MSTVIIPTNEFQTPITSELLDQYPDEVQENNAYTVYRHISPSGKVYVGITKLPVRYRWKQYGIGYQNCKRFFKAILKYGWNNIIHEIVLSNVSKSEAFYAEKYLIRWYKSHGISYNTADGGEGPEGVNMPEEAKSRISERLKEIRGRAVLQYSINGELIAEYKSAREASKKLGYGRTSVSDCAARQNGRNTLHGDIFIYKDDIDTLDERLELCKNKLRKYKIVQYQDGVPINTFASLHDAERTTGINRICIRQNIRGKFKIAGGYTWEKVMTG